MGNMIGNVFKSKELKMYRPVFSIFHRNSAILLEEIITNYLKLHISQNSHEKHGFAVNISHLMLLPLYIYLDT